MKQMVVVLSAISLLILTACGTRNPPNTSDSGQQTGSETNNPLLPDVDYWLAITDSIGIELGDSNLVFGQVVGAQFLPDGDIVVADMMKGKISVLSPDGEFIATVGHQGSGPGEFQMLSTVEVTPTGGLIVPDAMGGKLNFYDSSYNFTDAMTGFFPSPPVMISCVPGGFVGLKPEFEQDEDNMRTGMGIYLWTDSVDADYEYAKNMISFDINDLGATVKTMVFFDTDYNGNVFLAPYSTEDYVISCVSPAGEQLWQVTEDHPAVRKTDDEIQEEMDMIRTRMVASGAPAEMAENFQVIEDKTQITALEVDNLHRLWVMSGVYDSPFYRVYDCDSGDFLFTAALRTDEAHKDVVPTMNGYGITGIDSEGEDWPRVYIIHPEDRSLFQPEENY